MARRYKGKKIPEIIRVTPLPDYRLKLELTSGSLLRQSFAKFRRISLGKLLHQFSLRTEGNKISCRRPYLKA